jgi:hypothetical protein
MMMILNTIDWIIFSFIFQKKNDLKNYEIYKLSKKKSYVKV